MGSSAVLSTFGHERGVQKPNKWSAMIFDQEKYFLCGDQFLSIYYGDGGSFEENILAIAQNQAIQEAKIRGVMETAVTASSVLIRYDPSRWVGTRLIDQIREMARGVKAAKGRMKIHSAMLTLPMLYDDPWTRECARAHQVPPNLEVIARFNGVGSTEEVIRIHSAATYWVRYVAGPGLVGLIPLTQERALLAPKYERPRAWTPSRTFGLGGHVTSYYPFEMPGGIQLLGRLPVPLFDATRSHPAFGESPVICQIGYRIKFEPISKAAYDQIEGNFPKYEYRLERDMFEFERKGA